MSDIKGVIKTMLGIKGKAAPHTVLSDLNEITCFATLCDPESIAGKCILPLTKTNMATSPAVETGFEEVRVGLGGALDPADIAAFALIKNRIQTVLAATPKGQQAGGIKIVQGYNEAMFLVNQLRSIAVISESYFTNTKALLQNALQVAGASTVATALNTPGWRPNPADILIKTTSLAAGGAVRVLGVSLKASYGKCAPTICNFGMHGYGWNIASFGQPVLKAHQRGIAGQGEKTKLLIKASQQVVHGIETTYAAAAGGAREFLEAMLHCQPNNLPYLFVAAQGGTCYGIDFDKFKRRLSTASITVKAQTNDSKIGQSLVFTISSGGSAVPLEFSFRVKRTANSATDPSLKINVTMTPKTKTFLCDHFPISGVGGQCSMKGGGKSHIGMVLRSGRQLPGLVPSANINSALGSLALPEQLCMIDEALDDEPIDGATASGGGMYGGRRRRKRRTRRKRRSRRTRTRRRQRRRRKKSRTRRRRR